MSSPVPSVRVPTSSAGSTAAERDPALAATLPQVDTGTRVTVFGKSDVGRVRGNNEDAFVVSDLTAAPALHAMATPATLAVADRGVLLAVSDGMGGRAAGEVASALALHALRKNMTEVRAESAEAALRASVEGANLRVFTEARESRRAGMGATLTAVLLHGRFAYIAEIGDSRAYLSRGERLVPLTRDQSYVQHLLDSGVITRDQADTCEYKNVILQAMGTQPTVVVALNRLSLRRGDRLLLCSDGLTGKVTDAEIQALLAAQPRVEGACEAAIALALERGGDDNVTVIVAEVQGTGLPPLTDPERVSLDTVQAFAPTTPPGG